MIVDKIKKDLVRNGLNENIMLLYLKDRRARFIILLRLVTSTYESHPIVFRLINLYYVRFQRSLCNEIPASIKLGCPVYLPHPYGIIMHPNTIIGSNCTILHQVTIGNNSLKSLDKVAIIGDDVSISAGVKIIGFVTIGNNVNIGANSVVTKSFDANSIIAGVPAKLLKLND